VRRFAGGQIHEAGELTLISDQSLYLEPGAVVHGTITAQSARNIRVFGRGLFDATSRTEKTTFLRFTGCADVRLEDFLVLGAYGWTLVPWQCQQVRIANVKLVSWRDNDDGIDICASRNVRVEDCFLRTKDDCIALKAHGDRSGAWDVRDVRISRTVFWNAEWGNAMEIGFELRTARVSDVVVQDCDIIRVEGGAVLSVHNADFATVEDIRYEDIRVEDASDKLLELRVGLSIYSQDCPKPYNRSNPQRKPVPGGGPWLPLDLLSDEERTAQDANRGRIRNVVFRNITLVGGTMPVSLIQGYDARRPVENVTFEQVRFHDQVMRDATALKLSVTNGVDVRIAE
jgi:polygalacturonase